MYILHQMSISRPFRRWDRAGNELRLRDSSCGGAAHVCSRDRWSEERVYFDPRTNDFELFSGGTVKYSRLSIFEPRALSASRALRIGEHVLKSDGVTPPLDASKWPLLLKNYDTMMVSDFLRIDYHQTKLFAVRWEQVTTPRFPMAAHLSVAHSANIYDMVS